MGRRGRNSSDYQGSSKSGWLTSSNAFLQRQQQQQQPSGSSITSNKHVSCPSMDALDAPQSSSSSSSSSNDFESAYCRLWRCVEEMRSARLDADQVGLTYSLHYAKMREECSRLCEKLATACMRPDDSVRSGIYTSDANPAITRLSQGLTPSGQQQEPRQTYIETIRHWQGCQVALLEALRTSLLEAYQEADPGATVRGFEVLCANLSARRVAVRKIQQQKQQQQQQEQRQQHQQNGAGSPRNLDLPPLFTEHSAASSSSSSSQNGGSFTTGYEIRFANYDIVLADLAETRRLLRRTTAESGSVSGIPSQTQDHPAANVREIVISPRGNAVLEFAANGTAAAAAAATEQSAPVLRFRVSSHMLAEVSPVFASTFALHSSPGDLTNNGGGARAAAANSASWHGNSGGGTSGHYERFPPPPPPPPTPTRHVCSDGAEVDLYRMVQADTDTETNAYRALEIVLHAAHLHNEEIPRDVAFDQFVAIARVCGRYRCTSPLELAVEHRWLPQWLHLSATTTLGTSAGAGTAAGAGAGAGAGGDGERGPPPDPDGGLLIISYVFGIRRLFTRVTKSIILNLVDEHELYANGWPAAVRERILAVRQAKIDQVYACCSSALQEYLRPPRPPPPPPPPPLPPPPVVPVPPSPGAVERSTARHMKKEGKNRNSNSNSNSDGVKAARTSTAMSYATGNANSNGDGSGGGGGGGGSGNARASVFEPTSTPRCPKESHACDAASLGWLMKTFAELQVLPHVVPSANVVGHLPPPPRRSLNQLFDALRFMASPPPPRDGQHDENYHGGVCDYASAFRSAINDVYNSVPGLTLYDVAGRHGWGISRHRHNQPQPTNKIQVMYYYHTRRQGPDAVRATREAVELRILGLLDDLGDLHAAARINRSFYDTYKKNELVLMRGILKREAMRRRSDPSSLVSSSSVRMGRAGRTQTLGAAGVVGNGGGGGGGGYWRKSFEPYPQQQQQQQLQYHQYANMDGNFSVSKRNSMPIAAVGERTAASVAADVPVSYFEMSDDDDDDDDDDEDEEDDDDEDADAMECNNNDKEEEEGKTEEETDEDAVVDRDRAQNKEDELRATGSMTLRNGNGSRASSIRMVTREEAERILWPPSPQRGSTYDSSNDAPSASPRSLASLPPSYTLTATGMVKAAATTPTPVQQRRHEIPRDCELPQEPGGTAAAGPGGGREKFLGGGGLVLTEHKSLLPDENKHLRETYERLVGLHVDGPAAGSCVG